MPLKAEADPGLKTPCWCFRHTFPADQAKVVVAVQREVRTKTHTRGETRIVRGRVIKYVPGIDPELQTLAFGDLDGLAERCIEEPESETFHGIQCEITSFARVRITQNDHSIPAILQGCHSRRSLT